MAEAKKDDAKVTAAQVADVDLKKGFHGHAVDETPRENYTVAGVIAGKPTPETARKAEKER